MKLTKIPITSSTWKRGIAVILATLLLLGAAFSVETIPAAAASITGNLTRSDYISSYYYFWGDESRIYTYKYADGTTATATVGGLAMHYIDGQVAYCIEPGAKSHHDITYNGTDGDASSFWQKKLSKDQREAIGLILLYGAPNYTTSTDKDTEFGYEGATQVLIWEIIMGLRSPVAPYTRSSSQLYNTYVSNAREKFPSYITGYEKIVELIQNHKTIPSFSARTKENAPTVTLQYDQASGLYKATVTDANDVLTTDFDFAANGITMTKAGNTLSISAPPEALAMGSVLASATGKSLDDGNLACMIWTASGEQTVMTFTTTVEPVRAYFWMEAEILLSDLEIVKTSEDGSVAGIPFTVTDADDTVVGSGITDANGKLVISGLEIGKTYTVMETVPEGYEAEQESQTVIIQEGVNTVTFHNRLLLGSIGVKKVDINQQPLAGVSFLLEYSTDGTAWSPVRFREEAAPVEAGTCTTPGLTEGILVTGSDGSVLFSGLKLSVGEADVFYRLTEVAAPEGCALLAEPIFEGSLPADGSKDIILTAVNTKTFVLPFTGGHGFATVTFGIHLTVFALCTVAFLFRKRRQVAP